MDGEGIECDRIISTVAPHILEKIIDTRLLGLDMNISYQGTACALFGLTERVMDDVYWLNIKEDVPFGAVIEHTNFIPASDYGERLGYMRGGFQALIEKMAETIRKRGGNIRRGKVSHIEVKDGSVRGVVLKWTDYRRRAR
ncbi:MAG: hypothetical protein KJ686_07670 [Actinobacteria bacterium]|nr:hypothetical protein [Actinomycetota bacterium]